MQNNSSHAQLPDWFCRLCKLNLHNSKKSYADMADLIQGDAFLKLYVNDVFSKFLKKGGLLGMLTALGWEGIRNRLGEAVLFKLATGSYPKVIELDYVESVTEFEKRFDFLFTEGNSRIFLLGMYLKSLDFLADELDDSNLIIPVELDESIANIKNKTEFPDWLIISLLALMKVLGDRQAIELISKQKANIDNIINSLTPEEADSYFNLLLAYGFGINDSEFFYDSKVL